MVESIRDDLAIGHAANRVFIGGISGGLITDMKPAVPEAVRTEQVEPGCFAVELIKQLLGALELTAIGFGNGIFETDAHACFLGALANSGDGLAQRGWHCQCHCEKVNTPLRFISPSGTVAKTGFSRVAPTNL